MNEIPDLIKMLELKQFWYDPSVRLLGYEPLVHPPLHDGAEIETYIDETHHLTMTVTYESDTTQALRTLKAWVDGMNFLRAVQGYQVDYEREPRRLAFSDQNWVIRALACCPEQLDLVYYQLTRPFQHLEADIQGLSVVTQEGDFVSLSKLVCEGPVTEEMMLGILSGDEYKAPFI